MTTRRQEIAQRQRDTLFMEDGIIESVQAFAGDQFVMRVRAPLCAAAALPGSFVHLQCSDSVPMRRPLSIMRVEGDCIDMLYKIVGAGLAELATRKVGASVSVLGPIGQPFRPLPERSMPLLIGGGVGIPPMVFLADFLRQRPDTWQPLAILGSEIPFPFAAQQSTLPCTWLEPGIDRTMPLLEDWDIPCRLATLAGFDGCFDGYVTDLADKWLISLTPQALQAVEIFSCGPTPMLKAVAALAARYNVPCQVSLEEFMACAVGGCAGCTVQVQTPAGPAMKRVCVDGPVFDAAQIEW